jgi:hypothetical protein
VIDHRIETKLGQVIVHEGYSLVEYKADFDTALNAIGKGKWRGKLTKFNCYRGFGAMQMAVIADVVGEPDERLERIGLTRIPLLKVTAYRAMSKYLNGTPREQYKQGQSGNISGKKQANNNTEAKTIDKVLDNPTGERND